MSFIRCLNNPEGLYIWHDIGGFIAITQNGNTEMKRVPVKLFYDLCKNFNKRRCDLDVKSGPDQLGITETNDFSRYTLSYRGDRVQWELPMWQVTWCYIVSNVMRTLAWDKKRKRAKKETQRCKPNLKRK